MKRTETDIAEFVTITNIITFYHPLYDSKNQLFKQMKTTAFRYHGTTLTAVEPSTEPPNFSTEPQPNRHQFIPVVSYLVRTIFTNRTLAASSP
jgi:hypothetical protein